MSGGVDSSVAAYLMIQAGYDCAGATMKLYDNLSAASQATVPAALPLIQRMREM